MGVMHNAIKKITKIPHAFKFYGEAFAVRTGGGGKFHNFTIFSLTFYNCYKVYPKCGTKFYVHISGAYKGCLFYYSAKNRQMVQELTYEYPPGKHHAGGTATLNVSCFFNEFSP